MIDNAKHKKDTVSGIKWTVLNQVITQGVTFGLGILLMSLIAPREFGLLGMVTVFSGFLSVFKDFGLGSSLIQKKEIQKKEIDSIYWTTVGLGLFLTILLIALAPVIANYYEEPRLFEISLSLSCLFLLQSFSSVQMSLAKKRMRFRLIFQVNTMAVIISGIVALSRRLMVYAVVLIIGYLLLTRELNRLNLKGLVNLIIIALYVISLWGLLFLFLDRNGLKEQINLLRNIL